MEPETPTRTDSAAAVRSSYKTESTEKFLHPRFVYTEVRVRSIDTPIGELLLAGTERGIVRVAFACEDYETVLAELSTAISPTLRPAGSSLDDAVHEIGAYFEGVLTSFSVPLDPLLSTGFRRQVQKSLTDIPYGSVCTYKELASRAMTPGASRAVGTACSENPLPLFQPCHRVVRTDGTLGGYRGGLEAKRWLLDLESDASFPE